MEAGKRLIGSKGPTISDLAGKIGGPFTVLENPEWIQKRLELFEKYYSEYVEHLNSQPKEPILITLPDGNSKTGTSWQTTPLDIAKQISKKLAENVVVAKVRYTRKVGNVDELVSADQHEEETVEESDHQWELQDLNRPLEGDCELQLVTFDEKEGKITFWHSSAHILGASMEATFGAHLCHGPPIDPGFFYDAYMGDYGVSQEHFPKLQEAAEKLVSSNAAFQRIVLSKEQALELFSYNPFKQQIISTKIPDGGKTTAYRCGYFVDLCTGPHVPSTNRIKAFAILKNSAAYWLGKSDHDTLQRVYGVSYPNKKELQQYLHFLEEAAKRDHRNVGRAQDLYFWHPYSPGSTFFLPYGARIYNKLTEFIRKEYRYRGFTEVVTPNMYNAELWKTSGHYKNYKDDMFMFLVENQEFGLKPMNCPGHCLMFDHAQRSYRELPIRFSDFGVLHRNEASGALTGLTRVRRFQQDDAHIFCRRDQIMDEVMGALDFLKYVYDIFGFYYEFELSTRPEKALGSKDLWDQAEAALAEALNKSGKQWKLNPGDGAFYGPKIDIKVFDALNRKHQCGTIQLDFNLPIRFNLQYRSEDATEKPHVPHEYDDFVEKPLKPGFERPVIIHRAILGSVERLIAILTEHTAGKWPFWISPRQAIVIPVGENQLEYAQKVCNRLTAEGFYVEVDTANAKLNKKIRNAQLSQFNYMLIVGPQEVESNLVDIRSRDSNASIGKFNMTQTVEFFKSQDPKPSDACLRMQHDSVQSEQVEIRKVYTFKDLNETLANQPYLGGESPNDEDKHVFSSLIAGPDESRYPHLAAWYSKLSS